MIGGVRAGSSAPTQPTQPHTCINRCASNNERKRRPALREDHGAVEGRKRAPPVVADELDSVCGVFTEKSDSGQSSL